MFYMGNKFTKSSKINFQDIQFIIKNPKNYILINTLNEIEQDCLIINTIHFNDEEKIVNHLIQNDKLEVTIVIYGKNCNDEKIYEKYNQLFSLGFYNIFIYVGGLFEWLLLQDIYGTDEFPTTKKELDILKFKPNKIINTNLLNY